MEEIDALLEGEASVTADATVAYESASTAAGVAAVTEAATLQLRGGVTAAGAASGSASGAVAYAVQGLAAADSSLSGALSINVTMTAVGVSNASAIPTAVADANASGVASVSAAASVIRGVDVTAAGAADLSLDYGRITASLGGTAAVTADIALLVLASTLIEGSAATIETAKLLLVGQVAAGGAATVQAIPTPDLTVQLTGSASMQVSQPSVLVNASMTAAASVTANALVNGTSVVTMAGAAAVSASPNFIQVQLTATLQGGSDLHADPLSLGEWGSDSYGTSPYGGAHPAYGLLSAEALSPTLVRVRYTAMFDGSFPALISPFNYVISPLIAVHSISLESAQSVLLVTDPLTEIPYTVTISDARGYFGQPLDPYRRSATFTGVPSTPTFYARATRNTRVRVVFTDIMLQNSALTDPGQYQLTDMTGASVTIDSVETEQSTDVRSVVLILGAALGDERHYQVTTLSGIVTADLLPMNPNTSVFQWVENVLRTQIPLELFSGEVQNGLYGIHGGLVFFSPALQNAAANSIIQVEEVDVCTRAYDEYHFPEPVDPPAFFTYGAPESLLNSTASLWAPFPRLSEARLDLETSLADTLSPPVDAICDITLSETWDLSRVSLLNITQWRLWAPPGSGAIASIAAAAPGFFTLSGLSGMSALDVGSFLIISGAAYEGNNGTFRISAFISATSVEIANTFGVGPDVNNGSIGWTKPDPFIVAKFLRSGGLANILPAGIGSLTVTGLTEMTPLDVGDNLALYGADSVANNGSFLITAYLTPSSVEIANVSGVSPDLNNGAIGWATSPVALPPGTTTKKTYLQFNMHGEAQATETANVLLAAQSTMAGSSAAPSEGTV